MTMNLDKKSVLGGCLIRFPFDHKICTMIEDSCKSWFIVQWYVTINHIGGVGCLLCFRHKKRAMVVTP